MIDRRGFLSAAIAGAATLLARQTAAASSLLPRVARPPMTVYKDPSCGCCKKWVSYMQQSGFTVTAHDNSDMDALKDHYGVPSNVRSCHTALVGNYVIEGHVPAADVDKLLAAQTEVAGLAVPGMVTGSPGMEGGTPQKYTVLGFKKSGSTTVFATHA